MAEVDTSIYKQQGGGPFGQAQGAVNLLNSLQQMQINQQQLKTQQFNLNKAQSDAVIGGMAPLATRDNITRAEALGNAAAIIRANGIPDNISGPILDQIRNTPDNPKALKQALGNLFAIQLGTSAGQPVTGGAQPGTFAPQTTPLGSRATQGTLPTGAGPEEQAAATTAGGVSGGSLGQARVISQNIIPSTYGLKQAIGAVRALGPQGTGPFTKEITGIKSFLITSGAAKTLGVEPEMINKVSEWQVANKYLNDWARQSGDVHSVAHLDAAQESNPNMSLQQNSIIKTARTSLALTRIRSVQQQEFEQTGLPASKFPQWAGKNFKKDPVIYMFDAMTKDERTKYMDKLGSKNKQDAFLADVGRAEKAGIIDLEPF